MAAGGISTTAATVELDWSEDGRVRGRGVSVRGGRGEREGREGGERGRGVRGRRGGWV